MKSERWYREQTEEDYQRDSDREVEGVAAILKSTVRQLRLQLDNPEQVFLPAGSAHDAYLEIRKIVQSATSEILIVDSYVDGTLWALLTNVPMSAKIRIMTMQMKGDFGLEAKKFAAQHGSTIEVRKTA
jgi:hypothetical protein